MTDTLYLDTSEFQRCAYNNAYPYKWAAFRSNDGTYRDRKFAANISWAKYAVDSGRLAGFIVYLVYRENWQETFATLKSMVGTPHPKMAIMIDVESWGGQLGGNHSTGINALREAIVAWLGGNRRRVIGYGNAGDLASMWPTRGDAQIVLANYSANPSTPRHLVHQFTSSGDVPPFGHPVDVNSADGLTPEQFAASLGILSGGILMGLPTTMLDFAKGLFGTDNVIPSPPNAPTHKSNPFWSLSSHIMYQSELAIYTDNNVKTLLTRFATQEASLQTLVDEVGKLSDMLTKIASGEIQLQPINVQLTGSLQSLTTPGGTPA